ncbi:putative hydrophobic protein (TIGR00271 family) [Kordia periserrulae]|uniref:Putative hydrophobic protein (TIGR00271 family) n=1 Tax=Kordia periserrulae TaxID=701523 RepID=A0A2T6BXW0_9FLAO|nr:DUF389 domain-containing protein [Kordia periserrulae]PTX60898.1 putative hydrophobic protein (TIGR00271 family) [Kordia periserrulae]
MSAENENKFNFTDDESAEKNAENQPVDDPKGLWEGFKSFLYKLLDIRDDVDKDQTIEDVKKDIPFKGATAWILICSIFIASIGLNANSTAVVIGAMLISPLMGPILGMGMSIAINDIYTLRKSLVNFGVMVVLSVLTAFLFFKFFPLQEDSSELLARTKPDIRDVLIAFFGGLALIIARTKKGTIASVIFGVAIATALMPPLCTVGFGLAKGGTQGLEFAGGALYLFIINTIFIALATFLVLKILRFPMLKYANSKRRKRISQLASVVAIAVMIPAVWTFWNVLIETNINKDYKLFVENIEKNPEVWLQRRKEDLDIPNKTIFLHFNGEITSLLRAQYESDLKNYENIKDFKLEIFGNENRSVDKISDALDRAYKDLDQKELLIKGLTEQVEELKLNNRALEEQLKSKASSQNENFVAFTTLSKDAKIQYTDLQQFGFARMLSSKDFSTIDTIPVAAVKWNPALSDSIQTLREAELKVWLQQKLALDTLIVERIQQ